MDPPLLRINSNDTLLSMIRDRNNAVTKSKDAFDILIPATHGDAVGEATFEDEFGSPKLVRHFTRDDREQMIRKMRGAEGKHFDALLALKAALESRDPLQLQDAKVRLDQVYRMREEENPPHASKNAELDRQFGEVLAQWSGLAPDEAIRHFEGLRPGRSAKSDPYRLLSHEVSKRVGLLETELVLWWDGKEFRPGIYCRDREVALYVHTFFMGRTRYRICPKCGERFEPLQRNQDYCTPAHREAHRVARFRDRKRASKTGKGGGKNGT